MKTGTVITAVEIAGWLAATLIIFIVSLVSASSLPGGAMVNDKLGHFAAYLLLGGISFITVQKLPLPGAEKALIAGIWSFLYCALVGGVLELLQQYTGRQPDIADFVADAVGAFSGITLAWTGGWICRLIIRPRIQAWIHTRNHRARE